jgi:hypothetical protein
MKLYNPVPDHIIRVNIKKRGCTTEHVNLTDCTQKKCYDTLIGIVKAQNLGPFKEGRHTNVEIREAEGSRNGKAISFSFYGLDPVQVKELILEYIKKWEE